VAVHLLLHSHRPGEVALYGRGQKQGPADLGIAEDNIAVFKNNCACLDPRCLLLKADQSGLGPGRLSNYGLLQALQPALCYSQYLCHSGQIHLVLAR